MGYYDSRSYYDPNQQNRLAGPAAYNPAYPTRPVQQPAAAPTAPAQNRQPITGGSNVLGEGNYTRNQQPPPPDIHIMPPNPFQPGTQPNVQTGVGQPPNILPPAPQDQQTGAPDPRQKSISDGLMQQLMSFIGDPSRYNNEIVGKQFDTQRARLGQGFDVQRQKINEDASRRGLFYSTDVAGRQGDVAGQQAQAESELLTGLTADQAKTHGEDMQRAISTILGYGNQQFGQQMATAQFNSVQDQQMREFLMSLLGGGGQ